SSSHGRRTSASGSLDRRYDTVTEHMFVRWKEPLVGEWLSIEVDGAQTRAYLAVPESAKGPAVLVCHAWWGLTEFITELCERLAAEGFVALSADMYGGRTAATIAEAEALVGTLSEDHQRAAALAAHDALTAHPAVTGERVGAIGFSMGAWAALNTAALRPDSVAAVVLFYGAAEADFTAARAAVLGHYAPGDEWEEDKWVNWLEGELRAAGHEVTFHWYEGAGHWFFEDNRPDAYHPDAARLAWERTLTFLRDRLKQS
ncbi:MAG: dienelactone hydrolase family protein, partial [Vicinamibacterales bacterium]